MMVAVNSWLLPTTAGADLGEMEMETGPVMVTAADADLLESAMDRAVTVTRGGFGAAAGAV